MRALIRPFVIFINAANALNEAGVVYKTVVGYDRTGKTTECQIVHVPDPHELPEDLRKIADRSPYEVLAVRNDESAAWYDYGGRELFTVTEYGQFRKLPKAPGAGTYKLYFEDPHSGHLYAADGDLKGSTNCQA